MRRDLRNNQIRIFLRKNVIEQLRTTLNFLIISRSIETTKKTCSFFSRFFFLYLSKSITVELRKWEIGRVCRRLLTKKQYDKRAF